MNERRRRLFIALWPDESLRRRIEHATRAAARHSGGRIIPARNLHVTLAFLGAVPESRLSTALTAVREVRVHPFELVLGALKWWPRQELLCLEPIAGAESLQVLVERLQVALRAQGFTLEERPFRAHLTLAREVRHEHRFKPIRPLHWSVERIELIESQTLPSGSVYTVLA